MEVHYTDHRFDFLPSSEFDQGGPTQGAVWWCRGVGRGRVHRILLKLGFV